MRVALLVLVVVLVAPFAGVAPNAAAYTPPPPAFIPAPGTGDVATWRSDVDWRSWYGSPVRGVATETWRVEGLGAGIDRHGHPHPALTIERHTPALVTSNVYPDFAIAQANSTFALDLATGGLLERDRVDRFETVEGRTTRTLRDDRTDVGADLVPFTALWNRTLVVGANVTGTIDHKPYAREGATTYRISVGDWTPHKGWMMMPIAGTVTSTEGATVTTQTFDGWWLHLDAWPWTLTIRDARGTVRYDRVSVEADGPPAPIAAGPAARVNGPHAEPVTLRSWTADGAKDTTLPFPLQDAVRAARDRARLEGATTVSNGQLVEARYSRGDLAHHAWVLTFATGDATQSVSVSAIVPAHGVAVPTTLAFGPRGGPPAYNVWAVAGLQTMDFRDVALQLRAACGVDCSVSTLAIRFFSGARFLPYLEATSSEYGARLVRDPLTGSRDLSVASWSRSA
ncbi:MAG TPA: hypothetical protein VM889_06620 [Candidatus Thermoplasmatota archaeon]|nr:hypothetical protein [Candidatus Thermoplasmatota archaeon]